MFVTPRRILAGAALVAAVIVACSTFSEEALPVGADGGADGGVDGPPSADAPTEAAPPVCVPSVAPTSTTVTCAGVPNVDLMIDPTNCGACGRKCATCTSGLCPRETVGSGGVGGYVLGLTTTDAFVVQGPTGYVYRSSRSPDGGPGQPIYTIAGTDLAHGFAIDGDRLFVAAELGVYELSGSSDGAGRHHCRSSPAALTTEAGSDRRAPSCSA